MAVGLAFALAAENMGQMAQYSTAFALALGIGIQNFPEGAAVSLPLNQEGFSGKKSSEKLCDGIVFDNTVWDCGSIILDWYFIDYAFCSAVSYTSIRRIHTIFRKSNRIAEIPDSSCMLNCGWNNSNNYPIFKKYHFRPNGI